MRVFRHVVWMISEALNKHRKAAAVWVLIRSRMDKVSHSHWHVTKSFSGNKCRERKSTYFMCEGQGLKEGSSICVRRGQFSAAKSSSKRLSVSVSSPADFVLPGTKVKSCSRNWSCLWGQASPWRKKKNTYNNDWMFHHLLSSLVTPHPDQVQVVCSAQHQLLTKQSHICSYRNTSQERNVLFQSEGVKNNNNTQNIFTHTMHCAEESFIQSKLLPLVRTSGSLALTDFVLELPKFGFTL